MRGTSELLKPCWTVGIPASKLFLRLAASNLSFGDCNELPVFERLGSVVLEPLRRPLPGGDGWHEGRCFPRVGGHQDADSQVHAHASSMLVYIRCSHGERYCRRTAAGKSIHPNAGDFSPQIRIPLSWRFGSCARRGCSVVLSPVSCDVQCGTPGEARPIGRTSAEYHCLRWFDRGIRAGELFPQQ